MSKENKLQLLSPLFLKYQTDFEKNPRSRVFAPLAESYRKLGMTDKAMEILSQGIRFHPTYVMGYLGLAFCYFDLKQFNLAYSTLRPLIETNRDNLRLQKLFVDVCRELGKQEEALETLKYLLFINPRDKEVGDLVIKLEQEVEDRYKPQHKPVIIPAEDLTSDSSGSAEESPYFNLDKLDQPKKSGENDFDDWMTIDLKHEAKNENKTATQTNYQSQPSPDEFDQWNVKKGSQILEAKPEYSRPSESIEEKREFKVDLNSFNDKNKREIQLDQDLKKVDEAPIVTHTLVDLYCGQGHVEKALEVLEKILLLNPNDEKTIKKINEIKALIQPLEQYDEVESKSSSASDYESEQGHLVELSELEDVSEEDGRRHLMSLIDEKLGPIEIEAESSRLEMARQVEEKLALFLKKIHKRALDYQSRV